MSSFLSDGPEPMYREGDQPHNTSMTLAMLQLAVPFLERIPDAFFAYDRQWHLLYVNAQAEVILGQKCADVLGKGLWDLYPELVGTVQYGLYQRAMQSLESLQEECQGDRTARWYEARFLPFAEGLLVYLTDITKRKQLEEELYRERQAFRMLADNALDVITRFDRHLRHLYVNPAITTATGMVPQDIIGRTNEELGMPAEGLMLWNTALESVIALGEPKSIDFTFPTPEGEIRFYQSRITAERDSNGQIVSALAISRDVTELKRAEEALRKSERRYRIMGETVPYGLWMCSATGQLEYVSQSFLDMIGMTLGECLERGWFHRVAPEAVSPIREKWQRCLATGAMWEQEYRIRGVDGHWHTVFTRGLPVHNELGQTECWVGFTLDMDERAALQEEMRQHASLLNAIVETAVDAISLKDQDGKYLLVNPQAARVLGKSVAEILGHDNFDFFPTAIAEQLCKDDMHIISTGASKAAESKAVIDGEERVFLSTRVPYTDRYGHIMGIINIAKDITELKEQEQQKDAFISMASHELRSPITAAKGNLQLIERRLRTIQRLEDQLPDAIRRNLSEINIWVTRAVRQLNVQNRLINDLLDVSRIQMNKLDLSPALADLIELVEQMVEDQRAVTPDRTIQIETGNEEAILVMMDRDRIGQVINNYLTNALKYSASEQPVQVGVTLTPRDVRVWIRDHGPGLSAEAQRQVWDRFYQVQGIRVQSGSGVGLGLGLYICQTLIGRHNGQVGVESTLGQGSTFWFTLPRADRLPSGMLNEEE